MFHTINRTLQPGRIRLRVSAKKIPSLFAFYSKQLILNIVGVDPVHSTLKRIVVATDDTH